MFFAYDYITPKDPKPSRTTLLSTHNTEVKIMMMMMEEEPGTCHARHMSWRPQNKKIGQPLPPSPPTTRRMSMNNASIESIKYTEWQVKIPNLDLQRCLSSFTGPCSLNISAWNPFDLFFITWIKSLCSFRAYRAQLLFYADDTVGLI